MTKNAYQRVGELLILIGSIIALIFGILLLIPGVGIRFVPWCAHCLPFVAGFFGVEWLFGVIVIILSIITMATSGFINLPWKLERNWLIPLILGIFMSIFGGDVGAILVIIGAIVLIFV